MVNIAVIGGVTIDCIFDELENWPQPGQATPGRFREEPGGKGLNQAIGCARLGASTTLISAVGDDIYSDLIHKVLQREGVVTRLERHQNTRTDMVAVLSQPLSLPGFVGCRCATDLLSDDYIERNLADIVSADVLLITFDVSPRATAQVIRRLQAYSKRPRIIVNPAPPLEWHEGLDSIDYLVPNQWESRELCRLMASTGSDIADEWPLDRVGQTLKQMGPRTVIVTQGSEGCTVFGESSAHNDAFTIELVDKTGASDAFCAALAVRLAEVSQVPEDELIRFACAAGAMACTKRGAAYSMPTRAEVEQLLRRSSAPTGEKTMSQGHSGEGRGGRNARRRVRKDALQDLWSPISLVMFDFDDTLMATVKTRWKALIATAEYFGLTLDEDTIRQYWGKPFDQLIANLYPSLDFDVFLPRYRETMSRFTPEPTLGAPELLQWLSSAPKRLEVLTSSREDLVRQDLEVYHLDQYIMRIWDHRQTDPYHKPDRHVFDTIMDTWRSEGIDLAQVVYIGDSVRDYRPAEGNYIKFIGVTTGLETKEDFLAANLSHELIFPSLLALLPKSPLVSTG